jgi:hypothetical protein
MYVYHLQGKCYGLSRSPYLNKVIEGDCLEVMQFLPDYTGCHGTYHSSQALSKGNRYPSAILFFDEEETDDIIKRSN